MSGSYCRWACNHCPDCYNVSGDLRDEDVAKASREAKAHIAATGHSISATVARGGDPQTLLLGLKDALERGWISPAGDIIKA